MCCYFGDRRGDLVQEVGGGLAQREHLLADGARHGAGGVGVEPAQRQAGDLVADGVVDVVHEVQRPGHTGALPLEVGDGRHDGAGRERDQPAAEAQAPAGPAAGQGHGGGQEGQERHPGEDAVERAQGEAPHHLPPGLLGHEPVVAGQQGEAGPVGAGRAGAGSPGVRMLGVGSAGVRTSGLRPRRLWQKNLEKIIVF